MFRFQVQYCASRGMLRRFTGTKCKIARLDHRSDIRSDQQRHPRTERSNLFFPRRS